MTRQTMSAASSDSVGHATLPANLPSIAHAKLPAIYEGAKSALMECSRIDECADWADKAEAMASYAKQADDDTLHKMALRIKARAFRRCGELLRAIEPKVGRPSGNGVGGHPITRTQAATDAGLSRNRKRDALRVVNVPGADFEAAVESDDPPTVPKLAERGKASRPLVDLGGRDPEDYATATQALGQLRRFAEFADVTDTDVVVRGAKPREHSAMDQHAAQIIRWLEHLRQRIEKETP